jgi:hypothetical protein
MSTEFRGSLQQQFGSLVFLFLSLPPFSILERKHKLKYGSCSMHSAVADLQIGHGIITEAYQALIHESFVLNLKWKITISLQHSMPVEMDL